MRFHVLGLVMALGLLVSGCVTGEKVRAGIRAGMPKQEVIKVLGNPDGLRKAGEFEALLYANRLISGWSYDRADYTVILQNEIVVEYGAGQVRQNSPTTLVLVPLR